jgi:histidinol phosphatase-like PHP family hydrolase
VTAPGDYHVHTTWSDGTGSVEECVLRAIELGLPEIGIADHVSTAAGPGEDWWLPLDRLEAYCRDVRAVAGRHPEIKVLLGLEAEYLDDGEAELDALAASDRALELNTDRVSDPAGVMYPSRAILAMARARGIPLVIDSDAHEAAHVGRLWEEAIALAREAGYRETLRVSDHALVPLPDPSPGTGPPGGASRP